MIRIAWQVPNSKEWIGGLNYFVHLANAIYSLPHRDIEPVILGSLDSLPEPLYRCPCLPYPEKLHSLPHLWDKFQRTRLDNGGYFARYLKAHGIQALSHGQILGRHSPLPAMCWIPDFQHRYLPHFFQPEDCAQRDRLQRNIAHRAQAVVLSSMCAQHDFHQLFPSSRAKTYVLHFVAALPKLNTIPGATELATLYDIHEPYFHVPNQLWQHKNHRVVIKALGILQARGKCPLVISTGQTTDYRNPTYVKELKAEIEAEGVKERFRILGLIPYEHVVAFMRDSMALINPSLFEGWSTTVEEAKSLGKRLLLSRIPVHQEQAPPRGIYFDPYQPEELAESILYTLDTYSAREENDEMYKSIQMQTERLQRYGSEYQQIIHSITL